MSLLERKAPTAKRQAERQRHARFPARGPQPCNRNRNTFGPEHPDVRIGDLLDTETLQTRERLRHHESRHDQAETIARCEEYGPAECGFHKQGKINQRVLV